MKSKLNARQKFMVYVLNTDDDFNKSQTDIAKFMNISQSTVSNAIRDTRHLLELKELKSELNEAKQLLIEYGVNTNPPLSIESNPISILNG